MADKFHSDTQEKIESIYYEPYFQDTGDLEGATATITTIAEASGIGSADYSHALTIVAPTDARLAVKRIASRLAVTIDSMTASHLYCRVYVDAQDADHRLFDEDWNGAGAKLDAVDTHSTNKATIFNLLKDSAAHTFYFFFWVDAGNAIISVVELWEALGSCNINDNYYPNLELNHTGWATISWEQRLVGTGTASGELLWKDKGVTYIHKEAAIAVPSPAINALIYDGAVLGFKASVSTDLVYVKRIHAVLRSER